MNEAARVEEIAPCTAPKTFDSEEQERAIESVARLLSSGRPLSEILQTVKLIASRDQASQPDAFSERVPDTLHTPAESHTHSLEGESTEFPEPANAAFADNQLGAGVLASTLSDDAVIAVDVSAGQQLTQLTSIRRPQHVRFSGLFGAALFWLIPTISLAVVTVAGKSLIEAGVVETRPDAAARAIIGVLHFGRDQVDKAVTPNTIVAQPNRAEPQSAQPDTAVSHVAQPIPETELPRPDASEQEMVQVEPADPQAAQSDNAEHEKTVEPDGAEARLTSEQITALLNRGDGFLSITDIEAARLLYERAAVAGNSEAAIRLGATFDPEFLTRAGLRNTPSDVSAAQYWYRRARDLQANQLQLSSQGTEVARSSEQFVTGTTAQPAISANQPRTQTADRPPAKSMQPMPRTVSSQAHRPSRPLDRHDRNHRSTNGPGCPHVGHCLAPP
jgi:hypothetical protein